MWICYSTVTESLCIAPLTLTMMNSCIHSINTNYHATYMPSNYERERERFGCSCEAICELGMNLWRRAIRQVLLPPVGNSKPPINIYVVMYCILRRDKPIQ